MEQEEPNNNNNGNNQQMQDDDDDLEDLELFHKSSLREKEVLPYPCVSNEVFNVQKFTDEQNQAHIGDYIQYEIVGRGRFAEVIKAKKQDTFYAIKINKLFMLRKYRFYAADGTFANAEQLFFNELDIVKTLDHPNIVKCHQILYGGNNVYTVNELCDLGQVMNWSEITDNYKRNVSVLDYISQKYQLTDLQNITRIIFLQIAQGIEYMHNRNITNRDIKVDNLLCKKTGNKGDDVKIADFTTVRYSSDDTSYFISGTPGFRGPQQQFTGEGYSCKATDIWSFGISLYTFYYENFPFKGEGEFQIDEKALNSQLEFTQQTPEWLVSLITKTTMKNWKDRIQIAEVLHILREGG